MLDAPQNYVQLWSATPISPWLLNSVFSSKSINNTLYLYWYDSCTRRYIYQHIFHPLDKTHSCLILTYATNAWLLDDNNISMILFNRCYYLLLKPIQDNKLRHVLSWNIRYFLNVQVFFRKILGKLHWQITFSYLRHFRMLNFRHFP